MEIPNRSLLFRSLGVVLLGALAPVLALAQVTPLSPEFPISPDGVSYDYTPAVATTDGGFLAVWKEGGLPPGSIAPKVVTARRFDESGAPLGNAVPISTSALSDYAAISVALDAGGEGLAAWTVAAPGPTGTTRVVGRFLDPSGAPLGTEIEISPLGTMPRVAALAGGGFVVVWARPGDGTLSPRIQARLYDASGAPAGAGFAVSGSRGWLYQGAPAVAANGQGGFVVVWERSNQGYHINFAGRIFGADGAPRSAEIQLVAPARFSGQPAVAYAPDGGFMVVWIRTGVVFGERFDARGQSRGHAFAISAAAGETRTAPGITFDGAGRSVVFWGRSKEPQAAGQALDAAGRPVGGHFFFGPNRLSEVTAAFFPDGDLVGVWLRPGPNGNGGRVVGRTYQLQPTP